jgi:hypothetical protein
MQHQDVTMGIDSHAERMRWSLSQFGNIRPLPPTRL